MNYWVTYAFISDNEIKNIAVFNPDGAYAIANSQAQEFCNSNDAFALDVTRYPVAISDKYIDGEFRRYNEDGTYMVIEILPTEEEEINNLKISNDELSGVLDSILVDVIPSITNA